MALTTGQEEAYVWGAYFNATALADSALGQILSYTPLVPNYAWHGSAYGMGDFGNNGCYRGGSERVLQHYRSGLNSIPTTSLAGVALALSRSSSLSQSSS